MYCGCAVWDKHLEKLEHDLSNQSIECHLHLMKLWIQSDYTHDMYGSLQGVESELCPSFTEAMKAGEPVKIVSDPATLADALNVPMVRVLLNYTEYILHPWYSRIIGLKLPWFWNLQVGPNSYEIVRRYTNNFEKLWMEVVKEEHIKQGIWMLYEEEGIMVEGGGAITLATCQYNLQEHLQGKK